VPAAAKIAGISESSGWRALAKARKHGKFLRSIENI